MLKYTSLGILLLATMIALGGGRGTARAAGAPPGLSADDWRQITSQLPSPVEVDKLGGNQNEGVFGQSVAISRDTIVVGAPNEDGNLGPDAGAAYVFERDASGVGAWGQVARLVASDAQPDDWFGFSVRIAGDTIVVGAPFEDGLGNLRPDSGAAYVFDRNQGGPDNWGQVKKLTTGEWDAGDRFGWSVAVSGGIIVVGASQEDGGPGDPLSNAGAAYVFERDAGGAGAWGQVAKLLASDAQPEDLFGFSVGIAGDTIVVGAPLEDGFSNLRPDAGAAYVFDRNQGGPDNWGQVKKLTTGDRDAGDRFGFPVAVSGGIIVVGASQEDGGPGDPLSNAGAAYVFERNASDPNNWVQIKKLTASDAQSDDRFGFSAAISGSTVIVGAEREDGGPGDPASDAGATYLFERNAAGTGSWGQVAKLTASDRQQDDLFGFAVAISAGRTILIGALNEDGGPGDPLSNAGAAYLFCLEDDFEENDGFGAAPLLAPGTYPDLQYCPGDPDYYALDVAAGETITLDLTFAHSEGNLDLRLYDPGQSLVAVSLSNTDNEAISYEAPSSGFYFVHLAGADGGEINRYTLTAAVSTAGSHTFLPLVTTGGP